MARRYYLVPGYTALLFTNFQDEGDNIMPLFSLGEAAARRLRGAFTCSPFWWRLRRQLRMGEWPNNLV